MWNNGCAIRAPISSGQYLCSLLIASVVLFIIWRAAKNGRIPFNADLGKLPSSLDKSLMQASIL
jgi:hypothetical protein